MQLSDSIDACSTIDEYALWVDPATVSPFATIRYYQRVAWKEVKTMIGMPRVFHPSRDSPDMIIDGIRTSAPELSAMLCKIYERATILLQDKILMGLSDKEFGISLDINSIVDDLTNFKSGYGFISSNGFRLSFESIMKVFISNPKTAGHFQVPGKNAGYKPHACVSWLCHVKEFKELIYVLVHFIAGLPKRGTEEALLKLFNALGRLRNLFMMGSRLALVGNYSKTSAMTGSDKVTLHFIPECVSLLLLRFWKLASALEVEFVGQFCRDRTANYQCYLFSSLGHRWSGPRFSQILKRETGLTISQIRQMLPALVNHYHLSRIPKKSKAAVSASHQGMGHFPDAHNRLYGRSYQSHPQLTHDLIYEVMDFSDVYHAFWGFSLKTPAPQSAAQMWELSIPQPARQLNMAMEAIKELMGVFSHWGSKNPIVPPSIQERLIQIADLAVGKQADRDPVSNRAPAMLSPLQQSTVVIDSDSTRDSDQDWDLIPHPVSNRTPASLFPIRQSTVAIDSGFVQDLDQGQDPIQHPETVVDVIEDAVTHDLAQDSNDHATSYFDRNPDAVTVDASGVFNSEDSGVGADLGQDWDSLFDGPYSESDLGFNNVPDSNIDIRLHPVVQEIQPLSSHQGITHLNCAPVFRTGPQPREMASPVFLPPDNFRTLSSQPFPIHYAPPTPTTADLSQEVVPHVNSAPNRPATGTMGNSGFTGNLIAYNVALTPT